MANAWILAGNYLRVRGEYCSTSGIKAMILELPPRARRILITVLHELPIQGTTSACAENTGGGLAAIPHGGNYLRVRGEYDV